MERSEDVHVDGNVFYRQYYAVRSIPDFLFWLFLDLVKFKHLNEEW